jgi:hypothetical protein
MMISKPITRRNNVDPRGVWMRQNLRTKPFETGRFAGRPMHALRIATIVANIDKAGAA